MPVSADDRALLPGLRRDESCAGAPCRASVSELPVVAVWAVVFWTLYFVTGNRRFRPELDDRIAYAAAGIVILNFIIKNGLLVFAGIDVIGRLPAV